MSTKTYQAFYSFPFGIVRIFDLAPINGSAVEEKSNKPRFGAVKYETAHPTSEIARH